MYRGGGGVQPLFEWGGGVQPMCEWVLSHMLYKRPWNVHAPTGQSVCMAAKIKTLHGVRDTQNLQRSEQMLIYLVSRDG